MEDGATEYIGTYKEHTIYIKSLQGNKYFGIVGASGRQYQAQTALPLAHERSQEGWMNLGTAYLDAPQKWKQIYLASVMTSMNWKQN